MKSVLFVDDEQRILDGLRDLLRKQRKHWDMVFALGGEQALVELARRPFDVVVSDMQMPGIDGAALLHKVKEQQPAAARIILSGHAERAAVINALPVAHQFLSKPCDAEVLRDVVERACGLQALLADERVRAVIGQVDRLPSVPQVYWRLTQSLADPEVGLSEVAKIIEQDAPMAAKVLQLVNSSYFGLAQKHASVGQAVNFLGGDVLKALALTAHVFSSAATPIAEGFSLEALQQHSLLVARIARKFLPDKREAAEAFTAGLVHDIGKIVLATSIPERYAGVLRNVEVTGRRAHAVEAELLGVTHAEAGAYLLGLWGLPLVVVEACAFHHRPELVPATGPLLAVHAANALSNDLARPAAERSVNESLNVEWLEASPFGSELPRWRALVEAELLNLAGRPAA